MQQLEHHNQYLVTFEGDDLAQAGPRCFIAHDYEIAKSEGRKIAYERGLDPDKIRIFYRINIIAVTSAVEVGQDTNYEEVIQQINEEWKPL